MDPPQASDGARDSLNGRGVQSVRRRGGSDRPQAAARAIGVLLASAERLPSFPEMGRPWDADNDFRELPDRFGTRGYVIRYRLSEDRVVIVRVWHALEQR
ncbi:MAG: type II toxin-antitoxin system RelE/ParE family toxin [Rhodospirillales bacterium]|nr:type II toxin-antitoxin system RelE/ParE family toxin [Rhodospirillales bacterium]